MGLTINNTDAGTVRRRADAGFSFLEIMVALAIVAALLVTLSYTTNHNIDVAGRHEALTQATMLARDKLTALRRNPEEELKTPKGTFDEPFDEYSFQLEVKDRNLPGFGLPLVITEISVTVTGRRESVTLKKIVQQGKVSG